MESDIKINKKEHIVANDLKRIAMEINKLTKACDKLYKDVQKILVKNGHG